MYIVVVVFSAWGLGAGFRPGGFSPTVSSASTMGWTGWKFVAVHIHRRCVLCLYFLLWPWASARNKIYNMINKKKIKEKKKKEKRKKKKEKRKKVLALGCLTQPFMFCLTLYFQYKWSLSIILSGIKRRRSYMCLAIDVAR